MLGLGLECILHGFQAVVCVRGGWCLTVLHGRTEHEAGVLCGGFDFDEVRFFVFLCVGLRFLCELSVAGCAHFACGIVGLATIDMTSGGWRILLSLQGRAVRGCLVRLVSSVGLLFQPEKSSWFFPPVLVVQFPFWVPRRSVIRGFWQFLRHQIPHRLAMQWPMAISRVVQRQQGTSEAMCCSRRHQKTVFLRQ